MKKNNILLFCSNPVNGGTAKIFYELVIALRECDKGKFTVRAAINIHNPVDIYTKIDQLDCLKIYSEEEICKGLYGGNLFFRMFKRLLRKLKYIPVKRNNIKIMMDYLKKNDIKGIVIHNGGYGGDDLCNQMLEAAFRCRDTTLCRIFVLHNDFEKNLFSRIRFYWYDKTISKQATDMVTVSEFTRNRIEKSSFITKDMNVIYNGLPENNNLTTAEKHKNINLDDNNQNILMLGNFLANKGQLEFIDAAKLVCKRLNNAYITFIGNVYDDYYFQLCKNNIKKYNLENRVSILHGINNASEYMDLFDVVAIPSIYDESFGLIAVEAMAKGTPIVAFSCGGIPEVVEDGRDGYVVSVGDSAMMAEKIIEILTDDAKAREMSQNGREDYLSKFSVDAMTEKYRQLIQNCL